MFFVYIVFVENISPSKPHLQFFQVQFCSALTLVLLHCLKNRKINHLMTYIDTPRLLAKQSKTCMSKQHVHSYFGFFLLDFLLLVQLLPQRLLVLLQFLHSPLKLQ